MKRVVITIGLALLLNGCMSADVTLRDSRLAENGLKALHSATKKGLLITGKQVDDLSKRVTALEKKHKDAERAAIKAEVKKELAKDLPKVEK